MLGYNHWRLTDAIKKIYKIYRPYFDNPLNLTEWNECYFSQEDQVYYCRILHHANLNKLYPFGNRKDIDKCAKEFLEGNLEYFDIENQKWEKLTIQDRNLYDNYIIVDIPKGKFDLYTIRKVPHEVIDHTNFDN